MKIELDSNKIIINTGFDKHEIHPFWLRERVNEEAYFDQGTQQRLYDPTLLNSDIKIKKAKIVDDILELSFSDGVSSKVSTDKIIK